LNEINININAFQGKRVLITPLNWGLGHATRCIPIIEWLLRHKIDVAIASDGQALDILKTSFPNLPHFSLPDYNIRYPFKSMEINMLLQSPKILLAIWREKKAIKKIERQWRFDIIISDNRYGCISNDASTIFITHQLNIMASNPLSKWMVNLVNRLLIKRFDQVWVPDYKGNKSLAGDLSTSKYFPDAHYLNPISRFQAIKTDKKRDILLLLSGPEPARTHLENKLISIFKETDYNWLLVRGSHLTNPNIKGIPFKHLLYGKELNQTIQSSRLVICRSGYTSIMDLDKLKQKAILIPTPGQTEQEYLAIHLEENPLFSTWYEEDRIEQLLQLIETKLD